MKSTFGPFSTLYSTRDKGEYFYGKEVCPICGRKNIEIKYEFRERWSSNSTSLSQNARFIYQGTWLSGKMLIDRGGNREQVCERCYKIAKLKE